MSTNVWPFDALFQSPIIAYTDVVARSFFVTTADGDFGFWRENAALDSDDLLYLKEQMEAEEDAERLRRRTEKRAFAAFKISSLRLALEITFLI